VLPKAPLAREPSAGQQGYSHGDFQGKAQIGSARSSRFKECFSQQFVTTQTADCVPFMFG
jgi:hypothetical protein